MLIKKRGLHVLLYQLPASPQRCCLCASRSHFIKTANYFMTQVKWILAQIPTRYTWQLIHGCTWSRRSSLHILLIIRSEVREWNCVVLAGAASSLWEEVMEFIVIWTGTAPFCKSAIPSIIKSNPDTLTFDQQPDPVTHRLSARWCCSYVCCISL